MKITCHHSASSSGVPVILDDRGRLMDYPRGLTAVLDRLGWSRADFANRFGYKSPRSVEKFFQGFVPSAATLNLLGVYLAEADTKKKQ